MEFTKQYAYIGILYLVTGIYILIDNNPAITLILVLFLMVYHIVTLKGLLEKLHMDKEVSVTKLQQKLDVTRKESLEKELNFLSLTQTIGSGVLVINEDGVIDYANKDITLFFGKDLNNLTYEDTTEIAELYKFISKAFLSEKHLREQMVNHDKYYDLISTPIFENDLFRGCVIVAHDVTALRNAENFQKQFTADVSHELKTPLASIKGLSEILSRDETMDVEDQKEFTKLINKEASRMETILKDLLIISKMDRLDYELVRTKHNVADVLKGVISSLKRLADEKNITMISDIEDATIPMSIVKLEQVFINLVKNAINYTDQGTVTVFGKRDKDEYVISISDTGIGIDKEHIETIFKRFFRVDSARSRDTGGSGLGLSISKNVVKKHGGSISVKSEVNNGSTFIVRLPLKT